jgi:type II secretion system protein N
MKFMRLLGYSSWFWLFFGLGLLFTFPLDGLRPLAIAKAEQFLGKGKQGPNGKDPVVTIGELGLSGLWVKASRVHIQLGAKDPDPGPEFDIDSVKVSASLLSLVRSVKTVQVRAELYKGDVDADVSVDDKGNVTGFDVGVDDVELGEVVALMQKIGMPIAGKINGRFDVGSSGLLEKDGEGKMNLNVKGLVFGPGTLKAGIAGSYEFPNAINLGELVLKAPVKQGVASIEALKLDGVTDLQAELTGTMNLRSRLEGTRIDLDGFFKPMPSLFEKSTKVRDAIEIAEKISLPGAPSLSKAKDEEGRYHFSLRGPLPAIQPQLSTTGGKKGGRPAPTTKPAAPTPPRPPPPAPTPAAPVPQPPAPAAVDVDKGAEKPPEKVPEKPDAADD